MDNEQAIEQINLGRRATYAMDFIEGILSQQEVVHVTRIKQLFRDGDYSQQKLLACAASLCTLDDIRAKLIRLSKDGERVSGDLNG